MIRCRIPIPTTPDDELLGVEPIRRCQAGAELLPHLYAGAGARYSTLSFDVVRVPSATVTDQYLTGELYVELTL